MLTEYQARKLQVEMRRELQAGPAALWKCAAGLVVIALLAVIGAQDGTGRDTVATSAAVASVGAPHR